jgi:hypothetical protein
METITITSHDRTQHLYLRPAAWAALAVWTERRREAQAASLGQTIKPGPVMRELADLETDPTTARLIALARELPVGNYSHGLDPDDTHDHLHFSAAAALDNLHSELEPRPVLAVDVQPDSCRHGVAYSDICDECEA